MVYCFIFYNVGVTIKHLAFALNFSFSVLALVEGNFILHFCLPHIFSQFVLQKELKTLSLLFQKVYRLREMLGAVTITHMKGVPC